LTPSYWLQLRNMRTLPKALKYKLERFRGHLRRAPDGLRFGLTPWSLDAIDPWNLSFTKSKGRQAVSADLFAPHPRTAVLLAFGQSNIANECDPGGLYVPVSGVYNFNFFDRRFYIAKDPLFGATMDLSNPLTRLGDLLVHRTIFDRVLLVPIAHGGTYAVDWAPGGIMHERLLTALERLHRFGIGVTHALWQQGEAEGALSNAVGATWSRPFMAMVDKLRRNGMAAPIYVAQCTVCCNAPNDIIREAQRSVVDPSAGILAGPDIDTIGIDERWDGCHLSTAGLVKAAELWLAAITREPARHEKS
jgi:hypothetical protein